MKGKTLWILVATTMVALTACHKAEPPAIVQTDVAKAQDEAAEKEAKANQQAADTVASAKQNIAAEAQKADTKTAKAAFDVAMVKADGDHKIAVAKCERLAGAIHNACLDQADAAREMAKAKAEAAKAGHT
jgi:ribosomal protein L7/L12